MNRERHDLFAAYFQVERGDVHGLRRQLAMIFSLAQPPPGSVLRSFVVAWPSARFRVGCAGSPRFALRKMVWLEATSECGDGFWPDRLESTTFTNIINVLSEDE